MFVLAKIEISIYMLQFSEYDSLNYLREKENRSKVNGCYDKVLNMN